LNYLTELLELERDLGRCEARGLITPALEHHKEKRQKLIKYIEKLNQYSQQHIKLHEDFKILDSMCTTIGQENDKLKEVNKIKNTTIIKIKQLSTHAGCMANPNCNLCPIYKEILDLEKALQHLSNVGGK